MFIDPAPIVPSRAIIERRALVKRGAITMTLDPLEFRWNGAPVPLSPVEGALLAALVRRSRLRWADVAMLIERAGCCTDSRDVLIHRIRRKFTQAGGADPIETVRGWGLRFRTERDRDGSTAFWIGATEGELVLN